MSDWVWLSVSMLALFVGAGIGHYNGYETGYDEAVREKEEQNG